MSITLLRYSRIFFCSLTAELSPYKGMCHNLTCGETDENVELIFNDAIDWALERS
jgi:hypothetical protein